MATNNSGTIDISVHVTLDKEANKNVLSFIVREEYHLKKLAVGAYNINILDTQLLNNLSSKKTCTTVACGDYVIVYNFVENITNKINVILFNIKPTILKKGNCIFKIVYVEDIAAAATTDKMLDKPVEQHHANTQLFRSAFADAGTSSSDESNQSDTDECQNSKHTTNSDVTTELFSDVPAKRQKLDDSVENQV
ncbi:se71 [Alphabaculovirus alterspexiguae]|uniref:Se71 n=1 Tax=Spodoptera exigua multiple nucleopolyhedrovirus TaxID=10454 RepID=A0A3G2JTT1_9ABAC|nr:se71 [Spodoptera exigua multiple nucleopolyhedrovirus]AYN45031.1 se71 [Spodoptera exigua multiple nucleopolyhedrovirus]